MVPHAQFVEPDIHRDFPETETGQFNGATEAAVAGVRVFCGVFIVEGVRIALLLSTGERYFSLITNFLCIIVISRLMTPEEIGVSVVGLAIMALALSAREFVSTNYLIQEQSLTHEDVQSAFTMTALFTFAMAAILYVSAPGIGSLYEDARLVPYLRVIAFALGFEVVSAPILTLLKREMAFGRLAVISIAGTAVSAVVSIGLASFGFSYMSFAWGWVTAEVVTAGLTLAISPRFWIFRPCFTQCHKILSFGGYNGAMMLMHRLYEQIPYLLLGRLLSLHYVAIYSRSLLLCQLPDKIILGGAGSVILPAFSAEVRKGRDLKSPYLKALQIISGMQWPALCLLAILAHPAVLIVLGNQWLEAVLLVRIMAFALMFSFGFDLNYPILVSLGAVRDMFLRTLIVTPVSILITCVAAFISLEAVAFSLFIVIPFQAWVSLHYIRKHITVPWNEIGRSLQPSFIVALCSAAPGFAMTLAVPLDGVVVLPIFLCVASAFAGWLFGLWLTAHPLGHEILYILGRGEHAYRRFALKKA